MVEIVSIWKNIWNLLLVNIAMNNVNEKILKIKNVMKNVLIKIVFMTKKTVLSVIKIVKICLLGMEFVIYNAIISNVILIEAIVTDINLLLITSS